MVTHGDVLYRTKLIDQSSSLYPHLAFVAVVILVKIAVASIKSNRFSKFEKEEEETSYAVKGPIYLF